MNSRDSSSSLSKLKKNPAVKLIRKIVGSTKRKTQYSLTLLKKSVAYWQDLWASYRRQNILAKDHLNEQKVRTRSLKLTRLNYSDLVDELLDINKSYIDWAQLKSRQFGGSADLVSVVVLVFDNLAMTTRCIKSVINAKTDTEFELIVVNNGSKAHTTNGLRKLLTRYPDIKLIHCDQNLNFALGNNVGFAQTNGNVCVFLNNDTYVTDHWLDKLVEPLKQKNVKAVQPTLLYPDKTIQNVGIVFSKKSTLGYPIYAGHDNTEHEVIKNRRLQAVTAACMAVRSSDFARLNGFDPSFINGQEDVDFCLRLGKNKSRVCYCTQDSIVFHDEGRSAGRGKFFVQNRLRFINRWNGKVEPDDEKFYKEDGYSVESWILDSDENAALGIEIFRPNLKAANKN